MALLAASGPGTRFGVWPFNVGIILLGVAGLCGAIAVLGAVALLFGKGPRARLITALVLGAIVAAVPVSSVIRARSVPLIHDISTDTDKPPEFVAILKLRAGAPNPPGYPGKEVAEQQRRAYPDIRPLRLEVAPNIALERAKGAAEELGWQIVGEDPSAGRLEAVATTFWFGFKDDIVVRVTADGSGSRIDVRSKSRVGLGDVGTNARRIRDYLQRLQ